MSGVGWGILGAGKIAAAFVSDLNGSGMRVAAVGSRDGSKARAFAAAHGIERAHDSYERFVADPAVGIVYIATPQAFHAEHALLAIAAGKSVLIEKSFTRTHEEAVRVVDAARGAGVFAMEAMWTRFVPGMVRLRELIARGELGDVLEVHASHHQKLRYDPANRHYDPALGGGALLDLGVYPVSLVVELLGAPVGIQAFGTVTEAGVDTRVSALFDHGAGRLSTVSTAMDLPGPTRVSVHGTDGFVELDQWWFTDVGWRRWDAGRPGALVETFTPPATGLRGMHYQALEAERCLRDGLRESPVMPLDESIAVMAALEEMERQVGARVS